MMDEFDEFAEKARDSAEKQRQWEESKPERLKQWKRDVEDLFLRIESYFSENIESGSVSIQRGKTTVSETQFPAYNIEELTISISDKKVTCRPSARYTLGSAGVVAISTLGKQNGLSLVRPNENDNNDWRIKLEGEDIKRSTKLDKSTFREATLDLLKSG